MKFMVHLMELKPGIEEKVADVTYTEDEELQVHAFSSGAHAGICCTDGCKKCSKRLIATYLYCCFISNGDAFVTYSGTRECHVWSVPLHAVSFDACMHTCIAVGSNVRQSLHPSLLSMQSRWICLRSSAQAMSPLVMGDLMDQDLETKN